MHQAYEHGVFLFIYILVRMVLYVRTFQRAFDALFSWFFVHVGPGKIFLFI